MEQLQLNCRIFEGDVACSWILCVISLVQTELFYKKDLAWLWMLVTRIMYKNVCYI